MHKIKFKTEQTRKAFFKSIKENSTSWKEISIIIGVNKNTLLRYRAGESLIPLNIFKQLCGYSKLQGLEKETIMLEPNWGQKLGGRKTYKNHKWIFELGRKKGGSAHKIGDDKILNLDFNSPELAEFMGILTGDGFIGSYGRSRVIQITGHKIKDREYYEKYLNPLIKKIFDIDAHFYDRDTCIRLTIYSKIIFNTIKRLFHFPVGEKIEISAPENLIKTKDCKISFIRGLFDTDGYIGLQRKYPVIEITTTSNRLAKQVQKMLNELNFGAYICRCKRKGNYKDALRVTIFGKQKVLKWKNLIGSSNPYRINKINASVAQPGQTKGLGQ